MAPDAPENELTTLTWMRDMEFIYKIVVSKLK